MTRLIKTLIAGTALTILPLSLAYAGDSTTNTGSQILNGQVNLHTAVSTVNTELMNVQGDAAAQSVAAANVLDVTTMQDTKVTNNQYASSVNISSELNANVKNVGKDVSLVSQAVCNSANISTDPTTTDVYSNQECDAKDPSSRLNATVQNVNGNLTASTSALGNTFEEDTNAPNAPIQNYQINKSNINSSANVNAYNVNGNAVVSSSAIGNDAQIVHYSTGN
jgi:hypothetical protein